MPESTWVVVHFNDGRLLRGTTQDFFPNRPAFHVVPTSGGQPAEVRCSLIKACFFVKRLEGNPDRRDLPGFLAAPGETNRGKKLAVRFKDGELICGYALSYEPKRHGFFMTPADPGSNNLRIYVVAESAQEVQTGPGADLLVQKVVAADTV